MPVLAIGQQGFPAFFSRESGFNADFRLDAAVEQAAFIRCQWQLGLQAGVVVANPVPHEHALAREQIDGIIEQALADAAAQGISGKQVTPFLLARIDQLSGGKSLATNIELVKANAVAGAQLACALAQLPR